MYKKQNGKWITHNFQLTHFFGDNVVLAIVAVFNVLVRELVDYRELMSIRTLLSTLTVTCSKKGTQVRQVAFIVRLSSRYSFK